jgi:Ca2+-binding RTX toxin-like protein
MPTFTGTKSSDTFVAPTTEDWTFIGKGGRDVLTGNTGNDIFFGGFGNDVLDGQGGNDIFNIGVKEGADSITGGDGYDKIVATANNVAIGLSFISGVEEIDSGGFVPVSIIGSTGDDILDFSGTLLVGISSINGGAGQDTITGSADADVINGGAGNDTLNGGGGDDSFVVGTGAGYDHYNGGTGTNAILAGNNNVLIGIASLTNIQSIGSNGFAGARIITANGAASYDFSAIALNDITGIIAGSGGQTITGSSSDDFITGGSGDDTIKGGNGSDTINGGGGNNLLIGGEGDDTFVVTGGGVNTYQGGNGYDIITAGKEGTIITLTTGSLTRIEEINGGEFGSFTISGTAADDNLNLSGIFMNEGELLAINAGAGNDIIKGTKFADTINGELGDDRILSGSGDDIITGGQGNDYLDAGAGSDTVNGNNGDDTIVAGSGVDFLFGDAGNDTFLVAGTSGADHFNGGTGIDSIKASSNGAKIGIGSITGVEIISGDGFNNVTIVGTTGADVFDFTNITLTGIKSINGGDGGDTITGSKGADTINGGAVNDTLNGGEGDDIIIGNTGVDTLTGGLGADIFRDGFKNFKGDTITDFGAGDRLEFTNVATPNMMTFAFENNVLTVDADGVGAAKAFSFNLIGSFDPTLFVATSNGAGGTLVEYFG